LLDQRQRADFDMYRTAGYTSGIRNFARPESQKIMTADDEA
jgi:excinuclease UvrABC helicase subunit UvrB